jgi:transcriptional regulator with GAF, ATPase, and Fis domain
VKGAFTGASTNKSGYFEDAQDGTLFLDEIGELPLELQAKLLRVLENGEYQRVGETQMRQSRARTITATNRDLRQEVRKGTFRSDLYHRLSVFTLAVPALKEMGGDKQILLDYFRTFYAEQAQVQPFELDTNALAKWDKYHFPGNVRELRNIVIRLTTKHAGQRLSIAELEAELDLGHDPNTPSIQYGLALEGQSVVEQAMMHLERTEQFNLDDMLAVWQRGYIEAALRMAKGNVSQAAKILGINRTTLYSRMGSDEK